MNVFRTDIMRQACSVVSLAEAMSCRLQLHMAIKLSGPHHSYQAEGSAWYRVFPLSLHQSQQPYCTDSLQPPGHPKTTAEQYNKSTVLTVECNATCVMLLLPPVPPMLLGPLCHKLLSTGHVPRYSADRFWVSCCVWVALLVILESPPAPSTSDKLSSLFLVLRTCRKVFQLTQNF